MAQHHQPFQALAPVDWTSIPREPCLDGKASMGSFVASAFQDAEKVVNSIPSPPPLGLPGPSRGTSRARSRTDASVTPPVEAGNPHRTTKIPLEWKEVKINPRENPLGISVYKLAANDGKGSWFARRSMHEGLSFERWRSALEREFTEMAGKPGGGNIRGIGAERRVELELCDGVGRVEVFQLSAQFPGPTTPRDFVTLLLSSCNAQTSGGRRQFMIVSRPCSHPQCPVRPGFIRGQYESVELIREVPSSLSPSSVRSRSLIDIRADASTPNRDLAQSDGLAPDPRDTAIEWLMVTRSDPGGSVPRFMVEKGTPSGIISDAAKFLKWATVNDPECGAVTNDQGNKSRSRALGSCDNEVSVPGGAVSAPATEQEVLEGGRSQTPRPEIDRDSVRDIGPDVIENPGGFYSIITSAVEAASVAVASRLPHSLIGAPSGPGPEATSTNRQEVRGAGEAASDCHNEVKDDYSDQSSIRSFESAVEPTTLADGKCADGCDEPEGVSRPASVLSKESRAPSSLSTATTATRVGAGGSGGGNQSLRSEKEMRKLQARRQKLDEKLARIQAKSAERDNASREKAEREAANLQAKYRREMEKLEQKRLAEERKVHERVAKQQSRDDRQRLALELDRATTERDLARREVEMLKSRLGELQSQNTSLVAQLGRLGVDSKDFS